MRMNGGNNVSCLQIFAYCQTLIGSIFRVNWQKQIETRLFFFLTSDETVLSLLFREAPPGSANPGTVTDSAKVLLACPRLVFSNRSSRSSSPWRPSTRLISWRCLSLQGRLSCSSVQVCSLGLHPHPIFAADAV